MRLLPTTLSLAVASGFVALCPAQSTNDASAVVAPGAKLEKLAGDFKFTEGPTAIRPATSSSPTSRTTAS